MEKSGSTKYSREDVSRVVTEWQYLQSLAEVLKQRIDLALAAINEMEGTIQAIDELSKVVGEAEVLFMLGANAYAKGKIVDTKKILV
ncbi:MAG: hypothetical protein QXS67_04145, partial [Candidatus Nezhaarchaeales archaeon]